MVAPSLGNQLNAPGAADQTMTLQVPADSVYVIQVLSDGDWTVEVQQ